MTTIKPTTDLETTDEAGNDADNAAVRAVGHRFRRGRIREYAAIARTAGVVVDGQLALPPE